MRRLLSSILLLAAPLVVNAGASVNQDIFFGRVPEPETLALLAAGAIALVITRRRK